MNRKGKMCAIVLLVLMAGFHSSAQKLSRPKLVIGIVVDQMRWDYLYRYYDRYSAGGFKRMLNDGFSCENCFIPYSPAFTAPGHASIYTGSIPSLNGIIGNNWYDRRTKKWVYCTEDSQATTVGSQSDAGKMSPDNLKATTVSDELRLATNFRNKTISIALKDRGAILPGGHTANAAYWFDNATGSWITSSFYMNTLPDWVTSFNQKKLPDQYMAKAWTPLYPLGTYIQSTSDSNRYEGKWGGTSNSFPHMIAKSRDNKYETFRGTPSGNTYTLDFAMAAIENEHLGAGPETDMLTVSFSSPDYIGHNFGPNSIEAEDDMLRLDLEFARFLTYLDAKLGKNNYLIFLTADHGVAHNSSFLADQKIASGSTNGAAQRKWLSDLVTKKFGESNIIEQVTNYQIFLNDSLIAQKKLNKNSIKEFIIEKLQEADGMYAVVDLANVTTTTLPAKIREKLINGYRPGLSGDIQYISDPQRVEGYITGTGHGQWNPYDTHIPLLWYGWRIGSGKSYREVSMADIAVTLAAMLKIQMPNAAVGEVIEEVINSGNKAGKK